MRKCRARPAKQNFKVKFAISNQIPFLAQSGGHGVSSSISKLATKDHLILNLRALNTVTVSLSENKATIGGGAITNEVIDAAYAAKAHVVTGVCNSVGVVSALIGGGLGNLGSLYGLGVDNILSARLVTATGTVVTCSASENQELFWGLRGAGHQFGVVSELTVKAYPQINEGMHWTGMLVFPGLKENAKTVAEAIYEMGLGKGMGIGMIWARIPPDFEVYISFP